MADKKELNAQEVENVAGGMDMSDIIKNLSPTVDDRMKPSESETRLTPEEEERQKEELRKLLKL